MLGVDVETSVRVRVGPVAVLAGVLIVGMLLVNVRKMVEKHSQLTDPAVEFRDVIRRGGMRI